MKQLLSLTPAFSALLLLSACGDRPAPVSSTEVLEPSPQTVTTSESRHVDFSAVAGQFSQQAKAANQAVLSSCAGLQGDVNAFLSELSDARLTQAQQSYQSCHQNWSGAALFFQLPFELSDKKDFHQLVDLIDTRPFVPGYIDGIPEYPYAGLVNEVDLKISVSTLRGQHRLMDEESASLGLPVLEAFLWRMPVAGNWQAADANDDTTAIERRQEYLNIATTELLNQMTQASLRWQPDGPFSQLPERAQLSFVLQSLQRMTMVPLLAGAFEEEIINDAEWHHPAWISGHGLKHLQAQLNSLALFVGDNDDSSEFAAWLDKLEDAPVTSEGLRTTLAELINLVDQLPTNYPAETDNSETLQAARQAMAGLALQFSQLSEFMNVHIVSE